MVFLYKMFFLGLFLAVITGGAAAPIAVWLVLPVVVITIIAKVF